MLLHKSVSQSCFYHICALRQIRGALDNSTAATLASALVSARLDYANSILYCTSTKQITRLQRVQNALARVVDPNRPPSSTSFHLLKQLHWLPVEWRIKLPHSRLKSETGLPPYLSQQLCTYVPTKGLHSSSSKLVQFPRTNLRFGSRSFRVSAPTIWNSIPKHSFLRISNNVSETSQNTLFSIYIFCRLLATHYPAPQIQLLYFGAL